MRQIGDLVGAASTRFRHFLGASSFVPFPSFTDGSDKASSMKVQAKAARQLASDICSAMPSTLQLGGGARAGGGAAAGDDDDDGSDDGGGGSTRSSKANNKKKKLEAQLEQQGYGDRKAVKRAAGDGGGMINQLVGELMGGSVDASCS